MLSLDRAIAICEGTEDVPDWNIDIDIKLDPELAKQFRKCKPRTMLQIEAILRRYGYTVSDIRNRWKNTRQDMEALSILCDCFALSPMDILTCLGIPLKNVLPCEGESIVSYYAGA